MTRKNFSSGSKWEPIVGYSRAVRVGPYFMFPARPPPPRTASSSASATWRPRRSRRLRNIETALEKAGAARDVVSTRIFVLNIGEWELAGTAHGEFFCSFARRRRWSRCRS